MYKLIRLWITFKLEIKNFNVSVLFYETYMEEGDDKVKTIGTLKLSIEQAQDKLRAVKKLLKAYVTWNNGGRSKREVPQE